MVQKLSNLPVGAKVKDNLSKYNGKPIIWTIADKNHTGYPANTVTLISDKILSIKAFDGKEAKNSNSDRKSYGNNNYKNSNLLQWLNSAASSWYSAKHGADAPPTSANVSYNPYDSEPGFMYNLSADFRDAIVTTSVKTARHSLDGGGSENVSSKIFLASTTEVGLANEAGIAEGSKLALFDGDASRKAYPTAEAVNKSNYTSSSLNANSTWYWWLRTPNTSLSYSVRDVYSDGTLYWNDAWLGHFGVRPLCNLPSEILVSNTTDSDGAYVIHHNSSPEISGTDTNLGEKNQPFEIQYSVVDKDITDNVTITEHLNNSLIRRITNANNTEQTLKITSELLNSCPLGETNTIKIYAEDDKGAGTYRNYWFKRTNTPPYFVEENQDLGTVTKAPTIMFTAKDDDGDKYLKAKVKINQRVVKTYEQLGNGEQVSFTLDWKDFMQLHHSGKHNLWVEVEDSSGALATLKYTFERDTKKIAIATNTAPLDIKIKLIVFNANIKLGEGATFVQYACNDFGTGNTWEKIQNGVPYEFTNKHEGKDVIGYKCELTKGTGESEIRSIGGNFI